jgi:class 3 adenylate cyclase
MSADQAVPPSGVVTFLFTDIEGSTRRWEADADAMRAALVAHDEVLRSAIEAHDGFLFSHTGDGVVVDPPGRNAAAGAVEPVHQATRKLIAPYEVTTPLLAAHTIVINPKQPRTEEANGTEAAHPFVSVVGAAWPLMGQPGVTETRSIADALQRA